MELETAFGLIAGVLVVSALAAGLVERAPLSFPMLLLGLLAGCSSSPKDPTTGAAMLVPVIQPSPPPRTVE